MNINKEQVSEISIKLKVELTFEEIKPFLDKAVEKISKEVDIKGFRKGKATYDVLKKHIGEMEIYQEAANLIINKYAYEAIQKENIIPAVQPQIEVTKLAPDNNLEFEIKIELMPTVKIKDSWKNIKIKVEKNKIDTEKVDSYVKELSLAYAKQVLKNEKAEIGDKIVLDFKILFDNVVPENGVVKDFELMLGENRMIPGFEEELIGLAKDEEKKFTLTFPKEYFNKQFAGKKGDFEVKIKNVFSVEKPELNDDFAKNFQINTIGELKDQIEKKMQSDQDMSDLNNAEVKMFEELINICEFTKISDGLIKNEKDKMLYELQQNIMRQGLKFEDYLSHLKKSEEELKESFTEDAVKRLKTALIVSKIKEEENISVTDDEVEKELQHMMSHNADENIKKQMDTKQYRDYLKDVLEAKKVANLIKSNILQIQK